MAHHAISSIPHTATGAIQPNGPTASAIMANINRAVGGQMTRDFIHPETTQDGSSWTFDTIYAVPLNKR